MTQQLQRQSEEVDERRLDPGASDGNPEPATREARELSDLTHSPDRTEASTRSGRRRWMKRLRQQVRRRFVRHQRPAKEVQATLTPLGVSRALRHAREIEWCLRDAGAETVQLSGALSLGTRIGEGPFSECIYVIAADNRIEYIETLDSFDYEQSFAELLPYDAELILAVPYSSSKQEAALYEVQKESRHNFWQEAAIATR